MRTNAAKMMAAGTSALIMAAAQSGAAMLAEREPEIWRAERRVIDLHQHLSCTTQHLARAVKLMDSVGIGLAVNLSGGTVTRAKAGEPSDFERNKRIADTLYPGRFLHYMILDYNGWDRPDFAQRAVQQIEEGHRLGAAGFKEFKRLGLYLRDGVGKLITVDDPKLDPMWKRCGELGMPVSIHVADPRAFWLPYNDRNERWKELKDHKSWWFGDTNKFPQWKSLLESLNRVIARHPGTTFVCVHFANNAEELDWVDASLSRYPNMMADLAARIPEIGRHNPEVVRRLFLKHQDRILFGTDFQVYDRLILGSSGNEPPPTDADAEVFFAKEWRWLETLDKDWEHMTPIQGDWKISSIGLPADVLRKVYFDNARRLLARSIPAPAIQARRISQDFAIEGVPASPLWRTTNPVRLEQLARDGASRPEISTSIRALWSKDSLYLRFDCPFTQITSFEPPQFDRKRYSLEKEGVNLWDRDVVEAFIAPDPANVTRYAEFQVAPTNERLDLMILGKDKRDWDWTSKFETSVAVDKALKIWTCQIKIPLTALVQTGPAPGSRWHINFFRCDQANHAGLAWNPTLNPSFHVPERFGTLEFTD